MQGLSTLHVLNRILARHFHAITNDVIFIDIKHECCDYYVNFVVKKRERGEWGDRERGREGRSLPSSPPSQLTYNHRVTPLPLHEDNQPIYGQTPSAFPLSRLIALHKLQHTEP